MNYRDRLQHIIYKIIDAPVRGMNKCGITPNMITTMGFVLNCVVAFCLIYICTRSCEEGLAWCGAGLLFAGLFDMLDGRLARISGKTSVFGALYDSVLDRYSELVSLSAVACYFAMIDMMTAAIITMLALVGSIMVSYVRARAEGLGIECKVGFMQRPERVVLLAVGMILAGVLGEMWILVAALAVIAICANVTALWRIIHCYRLLRNK